MAKQKFRFKESKYTRSFSFHVQTVLQLDELTNKFSDMNDSEIIEMAVRELFQKTAGSPIVECPCGAKYAASIGECPSCGTLLNNDETKVNNIIRAAESGIANG